MQTFPISHKLSLIAAILFCGVTGTLGYIKIGWPVLVIVGGSGIIGLIIWYRTYLRAPSDPKVILPLFLLTVAGLQIHLIEEYLTGFGPAMSRLFAIPWTERRFLMIFAFIGPAIYTLTALGLYKKVPIAGFIAWFIFIGPGFAEFSHFIFPCLKPDIEPGNLGLVTRNIGGMVVSSMPNYYYKSTGRYYFSGMYTAILPMIPGAFAIIRLLRRPSRIHSGEESRER